MPVVPPTWVAEEQESLETGRQRLQWAGIKPHTPTWATEQDPVSEKKIKSKWIKDLNLRPETMNCYKKILGKISRTLVWAKISSAMPNKHRQSRQIYGIISSKKLPHSKGHNICKLLSDKRFITRIYKELKQLQEKDQIIPLKNGQKARHGDSWRPRQADHKVKRWRPCLY